MPNLETISDAPPSIPLCGNETSYRESLRAEQIREGLAHETAIPSVELLSFLLGFVINPDHAARASELLLGKFRSLGTVFAAPHESLERACDEDGRLADFLRVLAAVIRRALREPIQRRPVLGCWNDVIDYLQFTVGHELNRRCRLLFLNSRLHLIKDELHAVGSVDHVTNCPREVCKRALEVGAVGLIVVENDPSGIPIPSGRDFDHMHEMDVALAAISVRLVEHIIIGTNQWYSYRQNRLLEI